MNDPALALHFYNQMLENGVVSNSHIFNSFVKIITRNEYYDALELVSVIFFNIPNNKAELPYFITELDIKILEDLAMLYCSSFNLAYLPSATSVLKFFLLKEVEVSARVLLNT